MAKVRRKASRKRSSNSWTAIILLIAGILVVAAVVVVATGVLNRKPAAAVAGDATGLTACGSLPCPTKGDPNAPVTMIEVSDYNCSHCRDYNLNIEAQIEDQYIKTGKVRYYAHTFGFSAETQAVAAAALCANDQAKFWEYHKILFQNQGAFDASSLSSYAQQAGMDVSAFSACVNSRKHVGDAQAATTSAEDSGVNATPSFFINGKLVQGALPFSCKPGTPECAQGDFKTRLDNALQSKQ